LDAEKNKKLQQYATILTDQAKEAEQSGKSEDAIKHYLKLVDVFLVLASEAADHNTWLQYIRQAEAYQTRIRSLVPKDQGSQDLIGRIPPPPNERTSPLIVRRMEPVSQQTANPQATPPLTNPARQSPITKILKPFQNREEVDPTINLLGRQTVQTPVPSLNAQPQVSPTSKPIVPAAEEKNPVPHELYERALSENRILHERLQSIVKETDEKAAFLESRNRELEERMAMMVSRSDYDLLRTEFENTVPKHEYDRVKTELSNTVPISHYDQLLDRIANMVPREIYMTSERRVLELEDKLRHSVPFTVIDEIANEVSYVSILAEVPPIVSENPKKEQDEEIQLVKSEENPKLS
jgi:hypothetical protein